MKQTFKSKFSKNKRLTAIRDVKKLMKRGYSLSGARRYVSKALNIVPSTLYNWERELTGKVTNAKHATPKTTKSVLSRSTTTNGKVNITEVQIRNSKNETLTFHRNDVDLLRNVLDTFNTK